MALDGGIENKPKDNPKDAIEVRTVRHIDSSDEKRIRDGLSNALNRKTLLEKIFGNHDDDHMRDLEQKYSEPEGALFVVQRGSEVVGFLALKIEDGVGKVDQMRWDKSDPETIRALLKQAETHLKDKGARVMSVRASERLDEILEILRYADFHETARDESSHTYQKYL